MTKIIFVRNSEVQDFKTCRMMWWWSYVDELTSPDLAPALELGTLVHKGMEVYYPPGRKRGPHPAKTVRMVYDQYLFDGGTELKQKIGRGEEDTAYVDIGDLAVEMCTNYVKEYGKDDWLEVIAPEQQFQVDVHDPRTAVYKFTMVGTIDAVIRDRRTNYLGFLEHKTGVRLEPFKAPEPLDEQSGTYWTYGPEWLELNGLIPKGEQLDFIMFNRLKKAFADQRPRDANGHALNKDGTVSKKQPPPLFKRSMVFRSEHDRNELDSRIRAEANEMQLARKRKLAIYKNPSDHCNYCKFRGMCEVHETGGDWKAMKKELFIHRDPYAEHKG